MNNSPKAPNDDHISRRKFIGGLLGAGFLAGVGATVGTQELLDHLGDNPDSGDVLVPRTKFEKFVTNYLPISEELADDSDRPIPYEVFIAISAHESDSGTSELAKNANNMFGVIAKDGWAGEVYQKPTEEEIPASSLPDLQKQFGTDVIVIRDNGDGSLRVKYPRLFRKYGSPEDSFKDFAEKLYFKNQDGSYRYKDVVEYIQSGGQDPVKVVELMSDDSEEGEAQYATGREWREGVTNYIALVQAFTGKSTVKPDEEPKKNLPPKIESIDIDKIDFSGLTEPRDEALIETMKAAMLSLNLESYKEFLKSGIKEKSDVVKEIVNDPDYYRRFYGNSRIKPDYIVWHAWQIGVSNSGNPDTPPSGTSHDTNISNLILSWYRSKQASANFALSDNPDGELWQLTVHPFDQSMHAYSGVQDSGKDTHPGLNNTNSIGIEVQANSIYDVKEVQFKKLIEWTTAMLFESGKIDDGMDRAQINKIIEATVVGHGKNNGLEFGVKYAKPLIMALQQFVYIAIEA